MQSEFPDGLHVAIIMDGNGRWAKRRGLPRVAGHRAGVSAAQRVVEHAPDAGIRCLTLYAFSSDNWRRPAPEVQKIFWLLRAFLRMQTARLQQQGVCLQVIGRRDRLPSAVLRTIEATENATAAGQRLLLRVAIDYSSRQAIACAAAQAAILLACPPSPDRMSQALLEALSAPGGDVDLLIRTGGEQRLSDFLLWECAYAEFYFSDCMWPDFDAAGLDTALASFRRRERRFGAVPEAACVLEAMQ